jgi:tetraacyldisaccharide 4'-kinase
MKVERLPVTVLVVGNVVAGGAGKTPVVVALVQHLQALGLRPGVISRGHGRSSRGVREVRPESDAADVGDEPLLIARRTGAPVFVGERRALAGKALLTQHPQVRVLVCDDGLQHHALARDIEICVFDERGTGNGWPLPAGPLREPWPRRVDFTLSPPSLGEEIHDAALSTDAAQRLDGGRPTQQGGWMEAGAFTVRRRLARTAVNAQGQQAPLETLRAQSPLALAGIARPAAFFTMLAEAGCPPTAALPLPDHHDFRKGPALPVERCLVCTEKDAVKLWPLRPDAWAVPLEVTVEAAFWTALVQRLAEFYPQLSSADGSQTA